MFKFLFISESLMILWYESALALKNLQDAEKTLNNLKSHKSCTPINTELIICQSYI